MVRHIIILIIDMRLCFVFLLGLSIIIASCTKFGKNVTITGRVMNPVTGEGIEGAEIWLQKTAGGYDGGYKTVKTATSGSDGTFELNKLGLAGYSAVCGKFSGDYYELGWTQDGGASYTGNFKLNVKKGKVMHADYYAVPYGNYKIIVNNINCQGPNDTIIIRRTNQVGSFLAVDWILTGCGGYNSSFSQAPMGTVYTHYTVIRNGITTEYNVNFEILPNQDNIQTINY
jgi:hypothetical protein